MEQMNSEGAKMVGVVTKRFLVVCFLFYISVIAVAYLVL